MTDDLIPLLAQLRSEDISYAVVTVIATAGSAPRKAGAKMIVTRTDSKVYGTIGGGKLEALAIENARKLLSENRPEPDVRSYPLHEAAEQSLGAICGGEVTVLTETVLCPREFVVIGAGHCGAAIARLARQSGFATRVIDDRPELLKPLAEDDILTSLALDKLDYFCDAVGTVTPTPPWGIVAVSRNYQTDLEALRSVIPKASPIPYIGMIGSRKKVGEVTRILEGECLDPEVISRIRAPIGLDIGAESPGEIAVSVIAEFIAVIRRRDGRPLSKRPG